MKPFRFGLQIGACKNRVEWTEFAKKAEALGYDIVTMPDHLSNQFSPIPALMAIANATSILRIGMLVLCNDFRHPLVLAKELATLDVLSEGRLEIGLGAGWMPSDYEFSGISFDAPSSRIARLQETITIIRGAFANEKLNFDGVFYKIKNFEGLPKPIQSPMPPLLIGGGGTKMLTLATKEANILSIANTKTKDFAEDVIGRMSAMARKKNNLIDEPSNDISKSSMDSLSAIAVDKKVTEIRSLAGNRMPDIELNIRPFMTNINKDVKTITERLSVSLKTTTQNVLDNPFALIGPPKKLIDDLTYRRSRWGISYVTIGADDLDLFAPVVSYLKGK